MALSAEEKDKILRDIWSGKIKLTSLPPNLYEAISEDLRKGLFEGYGGTLKSIERPAFETLKELNRNIHFFSAAKVFNQTKDIRNFIFDDKGNVRSFSAFKKDADKIYERFNEAWQRTEFETTIAQAQSARQWQDIQEDKEILPLLKYQTAGDKDVRPEHAAWDNIVRPVDDKFWDTHTPPNGFNCRCIAIQLERGKVSDLRGVKANEEKLFANNPGKAELIFTEKGIGQHPYFNVGAKFESLKKKNFNLSLPK